MKLLAILFETEPDFSYSTKVLPLPAALGGVPPKFVGLEQVLALEGVTVDLVTGKAQVEDHGDSSLTLRMAST